MIQLLVNISEPELAREGWAAFRTAPASRLAILKDGSGFVPTWTGIDEADGIQVPSDGIWSEPSRGVLGLTPNFSLSGALDDPGQQANWIPLQDMRTAGDLLEMRYTTPLSEPRLMMSLRDTRDSALNGISAPIGFADALGGTSLVWVAESQAALFPNETFTLVAQPFGMPTPQPEPLAAVAFGGRWLLVLDTHLGVTVSFNQGQSAQEDWRPLDYVRFRGTASRVEATSITVMPWGLDAIALLQGTSLRRDRVSRAEFNLGEADRVSVFSRALGVPVPWNAAMSQHIKTSAGTLSLAMPARGAQCALGVMRCRYRPCGLAVGPERLDEPKPHAVPEVWPIGLWNQRLNPWEAGASVATRKSGGGVGARLRSQDGSDWDPGSSTSAVAEMWLSPSPDGLYSPELWGVDYSVPSATQAPAGEPQNWSSRVTRIAAYRTVHPEPARLQAWLTSPSDEGWTQMLHGLGRVRVSVGEETLFEGHAVERRQELTPSDDSKSGARLERLDAADLWAVANRTSASHFPSLAGSTVGYVIREALYRIGTRPENIAIDPELDSLSIDGFVARPTQFGAGSSGAASADDWKLTHENSSVGDLLRTLQKRYGLQGARGGRELRILCRGKQWQVHLAPEFDGADFHWLALDDQCFEEVWTDEERWQNRRFRAFSSPEFSVRSARLNSLRAYGVIGSGGEGVAVGAYIAPHPGELLDPENPNFDPRLKCEALGPPDTALASTQNELERMARRWYDAHSAPKRCAVVEAEWQPGIDADQFFVMVGFAPADDPGERFAKGDPVSYGVWRIETLGCDLELAGAAAETPWGTHETRHAWRAQYFLTYEGPTDIEGFPFFDSSRLA